MAGLPFVPFAPPAPGFPWLPLVSGRAQPLASTRRGWHAACQLRWDVRRPLPSFGSASIPAACTVPSGGGAAVGRNAATWCVAKAGGRPQCRRPMRCKRQAATSTYM